MEEFRKLSHCKTGILELLKLEAINLILQPITSGKQAPHIGLATRKMSKHTLTHAVEQNGKRCSEKTCQGFVNNDL
ncbi:hypothetical protein HPP92_010011 [Vanilla planifolia]|uniref:Uncharacterized protein n=1 Tax=Vanilla planifolia TaxID=51239 RepID=A0A835V1F6_VANPL|nr:hypothetical protein HPP92_010011 [Vanilla planifolia]